MEWGEMPRESVTVMPPTERISQIHDSLAAFCRNRNCDFCSASLQPCREVLCVPCAARSAFFMCSTAVCFHQRRWGGVGKQIFSSLPNSALYEKPEGCPGLKTAWASFWFLRPCGAAKDRSAQRMETGAFFSLVGKEPKAPSRGRTPLRSP